MGLRDDLIAAKALIDTPEKWAKHARSVVVTLKALPLGRHLAVNAALRRANWPSRVDLLQAMGAMRHADIMALFDRAIAAADLPGRPAIIEENGE